jgi:RHS repeat-associated protein
MQMQLASSAAFPEPLLAAMPQLKEKPHMGVPSKNPALHQGHEVCNSTTALGFRAALHLERIRSRYTGKERDTESGNDYFMARYYSSAMGRFMSPDWSAKVAPVPYAKLDDPQSLNLYAYVRNNPLSRVDVDGHNDYLWQKLKNWAEGNGYKTNAQVQGLSVAQTAANHKGDKDWAINGVNRSGGDTGHPHDFLPGKNKCNEFVGDTLAEAGKQRPEITDADGKTRMPNAHELADPSVKIPGLSDPKPLSQAQPGDVISQEHGDTYGHTGIVVGPGQTASSNFNEGGTITVNDWGFRPAGQNGESSSDPAPVVRTPQ